MRSLLIAISFLILPTAAWSTKDDEDLYATEIGHPVTVHLRTNLLYDVCLLPNIGMEWKIADRYTLVGSIMGTWLSSRSKNRFWRINAAEVELRRWHGGFFDAFTTHGFHYGVYASCGRFDLEWGGKGQMSDFSYSGGLALGYAFPIGRTLSLDASAGVGYVGGRYKEYEPENGNYVWKADKQRHYFGPTKAELTLVWHIEFGKGKGGGQ